MGRAVLQSRLSGAELRRARPARAPAGSGPFSSGARPAGPALARPGGVPAPGSVAVRAARAPARAPAAPQLPAREPIGARRGGGHFLVRPAARSGQLGRRGGDFAEPLCLRLLVPQPRVGAGPWRRTAAKQTKRKSGAQGVLAGGVFGWLSVRGR